MISEGTCSGATNQLWMYDPLYQTIVNKEDPKKCLDYHVPRNGYGYMHTCHGGYNQKWIFDELSRLVSFIDRNMCLSSTKGEVQRCDHLEINEETNLFKEPVQFTIGSSMVSIN